MTTALAPAPVTAVPAIAPLPGLGAPADSGADPAAFGRELQRATRQGDGAEAARAGSPATPAAPATPASPATPAPAAKPPAAARPSTATERTAPGARRGAADPTRAQGPDAATGRAEAPAADAPAEAEESETASGDPTLPLDLAALVPQLGDRLQPLHAAPSRRGAGAPGDDDPSARDTARPGLVPADGAVARGLLNDRARGIPQTRLDLDAPAADATAETRRGSAAGFGALVAEAAKAARDAHPAAELPRLEPLLPPGLASTTPSTVPAAAPAPTVVEDQLAAALGTRDFAQELGARVAVFAKGGIEHARLNLHPAELGPIALQLALDGTQLRVDMSAALAATRQALEQALPGLAGALADAGLTLSGGGVFEHPRDGTGAEAGPGDTRGGQPGRSRTDGSLGQTVAAPVQAARPVRLDGLVDLYA